MASAAKNTIDEFRESIEKGAQAAVASTVETLCAACAEFPIDPTTPETLKATTEQRRAALLDRATRRLTNIRDAREALLAALEQKASRPRAARARR